MVAGSISHAESSALLFTVFLAEAKQQSIENAGSK